MSGYIIYALLREGRLVLSAPDPRSDSQLIDAINRGDPAAFESLYYRYRDWIVRLAFRFTGNDADSLDVLQETFTYVMRKFPGFRLTASFTTFLYPAVKNLSIAARERRSRFSSDKNALDFVPAREDGPDQSLAEDLAAALARLPPIHREVLLMRFVDAMSLEEIAQALVIPLGTVKSRLHNALEMLRNDPRTRDLLER